MGVKNLVITDKWASVIGWYGTAAIIVSYALASFKIVPVDGYAFQLLNLSGAIGIVVVSLVKRLRQTVILNLFWGAISIITLIRITFLH